MEKINIVELNKINHILLDNDKFGIVVDCDGVKVKLKLSNFDNETISTFVNKMASQGIEISGETLDDFMRKYESFKTSDYIRDCKPDVYKLVMMIGNKIKILKEEESDVLTHKRLMEFTSINKDGGFWFGSNRLYIKSFEGGLINEIEIYDNESVLFHLKNKTIETLHPLYSGLCRNTNDLKYIIEKYM